MAAEGFGFKAIQARAKELGVDIPMPDSEHLFDLSSYVSYIAEKKLSIKQILWFNSLLIGDDYLDGKVEAEYFGKGLSLKTLITPVKSELEIFIIAGWIELVLFISLKVLSIIPFATCFTF